jgi:hypothetical protein
MYATLHAAVIIVGILPDMSKTVVAGTPSDVFTTVKSHIKLS